MQPQRKRTAKIEMHGGYLWLEHDWQMILEFALFFDSRVNSSYFSLETPMPNLVKIIV
jgi:hypothetical protein